MKRIGIPMEQTVEGNLRASTSGWSEVVPGPGSMRIAPGHFPGPSSPPASPKALFSAFRRRWPIALGAGSVLALTAACVAWFAIPAPYTAETELRISSVQEKIIFTTTEERASFATYKQSQMRMIKSALVLGAALREPDVASLSIVREHPHPVQWLQESLLLTTPAMEFLQVALAGEHPQELAVLVNAIANAYLEEVVNEEQNKRRDRQNSLEKIHRDLTERLRSKEQQLRKLAESLSTGDAKTLSMKEQFAVEYYAKLRNELAQITFELTRTRIALAAKKAGTQSVQGRPVADSAIDLYLGQDPEIQRLTTRIQQIEGLLAKYEGVTARHPNVAAYRSEIGRLETQLAAAREKRRPNIEERVRTEMAEKISSSEAELEEKVGLLAATASELQKQSDSQQSEQKKTGMMSFELSSLTKEITQMESLAKTISDELKRLEIELTAPPRITIHQVAQVPHLRNMRPRIAGTTVLGLGIFALIVCGVIWKDFKSHRVSSMDEVAENLGVRVMGSIPLVPRRIARGSNRRRIAARTEFWQNALSESIDSVRTILLRDSSLGSINVIMVSSASEGEGKTTLSCHLGNSLARAGRTTLLIDTDMRNPSVHGVFGQPLVPGFCELIRGEVSLEETVRATGTPGLFVMSAGKFDERTLRVLAEGGGAAIINQIRQQYAFIIVDSSPVLTAADAMLVAQHVDAVLFSIRRDVSRCAKVTAACQRLAMLDVPFLGIVAIGLDEGAFRYPSRPTHLRTQSHSHVAASAARVG